MSPGTNRAVLVLGGGNAEQTPAGWATKSAIARYLGDLANEFERVTWMAQKSGTWGVSLSSIEHGLEGAIDSARITVVPYDYRLGRALSLWKLLLRTTSNHDYGVFFLPASVPFAPVLRIAAHRMRRSAAYLAGDYIDTASRMDGGRWLGWGALQRAAHIEVLRACDFSIARGRKLASVAARYSSEVHETIPIGNLLLGEDNEHSKQSIPGRVLFIGIVSDSKGVGILIDVVMALHRRGESISLQICGNGPDLERFRAVVERSGSQDFIQFLGWVDDPNRLNLAFSEASLLVMPSTTHPEGVPRVIDEAIARGIPVVSTTAGGVQEEFTEGEVELVKPGNRQQLLESIRRILVDHESRRRLVARAAKRRSWLAESGTAGKQHARLLRFCDR